MRLGEKFGMDVIPVGIQFHRASVLYPEMELLGPDNRHPNKAGYFLVTSCIYYEIFGDAPPLKKDVLAWAGITRKQGEMLTGLLGSGMESNMTEKTMKIGDSVTMQVHSVRGENISGVQFTSLNEAVAQVGSQIGEIKAVGRGQAVIVAEAPDGQQAFCTVYVAYKRPRDVKAEMHGKQTKDSKRVRVKLSWSEVEGASYHVYRAASKKGSYKLLATVKNSQYIDKTAALGRTWYYKIVATNGYSLCESKASAVVKVKPLKVKNLKVKVTGKTRAKLTWKKNKNAAGYVVYRSASPAGSYKEIAEITSKNKNNYVDKNRKEGKSYYYKVVAYGK